jgi:peptidyl-prolyl cis-trans isomerase A (cyclophilin A)
MQKSFIRYPALILTLLLVPTTYAAAAAPQAGNEREPGLYMTFATNLGDIRCKLYEDLTPLTVKTVVGLATGKLPYVDPKTKQKVTGKKFYDGLTFHRVIPSFMIQSGDPLGTGYGSAEGPGFPFKDEFAPSLKFDAPGKLAMANSGPNTNGSQFFISEIPIPYLTGKHTIFGQCENIDVIKAIARVPVNQDDAPVKPVVIKTATVERVGPEKN